MSYRQAYDKLELRGTTVVGATLSGGTASVDTFAASASEIGAAEIALESVSGGQLTSGGVGLAALAVGAVSGNRLVDASVSLAKMNLAAVSGGTIVSGGVALVHIVPALGPILGGSPAAGGRSIYAGSGATGAGSAAWVVFPLGTFFSAPNIILGGNMTAITANTFFTPAGSIVAGSFYVQSTVASTAFSYLAIGSGRIA